MARARKSKSRYEKLLGRLAAIEEAKDNILAFTQLVMPHPDDVDDPDLSMYQPVRHHRAVAAALEEVERGNYRRVIINIPPRHGKTELASKKFLAWYSGRNPGHSAIFGTYNETFSEDIGRAVRDVLCHPAFTQVFPNYRLKDGSASASRIETAEGGVLAFTGRGGTITGRGGHLIVIDDPIKDRAEADSPTIRDKLWTWFTQVMLSRLMTEDGRVLLIQTRWHEDDLVGRLTDPRNEHYDPDEAAQWKIIDLPALALDDDPLGRKPGEPLWPERFGVDYLKGMQRADARGFSALYQGRPSPEGGTFFQDKWLKTYKPNQLPKHLRYYAASDHAVSTKQVSDKTCLIVVGVDENDDIYVMPETWWRKEPSDKVVEGMLGLMQKFRPVYWWAERGHISKSIGPFLRKRMMEEQIFCAIMDMTPTGDKQSRAQSIQGRMSMGKVFFPERAPWWPDARDEILKFPFAAHDDFVDALAWIGLGLAQQVGANRQKLYTRPNAPGTFGWLKEQTRAQDRARMLQMSAGGW